MDLREILEEYDSMRYTQNGTLYDGFVKDVQENFIVGRFAETNSFGEKRGPMFETTIYLESFKDLNMEWWFYGQGCDNSAIGVSGCWETFLN